MIRLIRQWIEELARTRELNRKLEALTNHMFFVRYDQDQRGEL